jgi:hypothetical protein
MSSSRSARLQDRFADVTDPRRLNVANRTGLGIVTRVASEEGNAATWSTKPIGSAHCSRYSPREGLRGQRPDQHDRIVLTWGFAMSGRRDDRATRANDWRF